MQWKGKIKKQKQLQKKQFLARNELQLAIIDMKSCLKDDKIETVRQTRSKSQQIVCKEEKEDEGSGIFGREPFF